MSSRLRFGSARRPPPSSFDSVEKREQTSERSDPIDLTVHGEGERVLVVSRLWLLPAATVSHSGGFSVHGGRHVTSCREERRRREALTTDDGRQLARSAPACAYLFIHTLTSVAPSSPLSTAAACVCVRVRAALGTGRRTRALLLLPSMRRSYCAACLASTSLTSAASSSGL